MLSGIFIYVIGSGFIVGGFTSYVASKKGYDGLLWFFLGLLFNLVALIAIAGLPIVTDTLTSDVIYNKKKYESAIKTTEGVKNQFIFPFSQR